MNLHEQTYRIKQMMGVISENDDRTNKILDKINKYGIVSLTNAEKQYLNNKSKDINDDELNDIVEDRKSTRLNSSH